MLVNRFNFRAFVKSYNGETLLKRNDNETNLFLFKQNEFEVFYDEELCSIRLKGYSNDYYDFADWIREGFEFEVIGNIYENQKLLKKNKEVNICDYSEQYKYLIIKEE
ncbi:MAG: YopX family protein [Romboutsia timonensis]|uniref:YopX family protein n=1 Tax=Romboutsia timonensis TaxID=1776391 RepID=UPI002A75CA32|nr:YopX family protein [Romboutsia timonensis]MDY2882555.1 YopX family protein [Romboutsia timonensis]